MSIVQRGVLVTGAAQGIGKAIALKLAHDGYNVAIADLPFQAEKAESVCEEIRALGKKSIFIGADSSKKADIVAAVDKTYNAFGCFNTIVNNAGIASVGPIRSATFEDLDKLNRINVAGVLFGIQAAAEKFISLKQPGKIINACSIAGNEGFPILGLYSASKFAVKGMTQAAAKELAPNKITVNAYAPGIVLTPMWDYIDSELHKINGLPLGENLKKQIDGIALGRGSTAEDVAGAVSFLASENSNYVTGQNLGVDGGISYN